MKFSLAAGRCGTRNAVWRRAGLSLVGYVGSLSGPDPNRIRPTRRETPWVSVLREDQGRRVDAGLTGGQSDGPAIASTRRIQLLVGLRAAFASSTNETVLRGQRGGGNRWSPLVEPGADLSIQRRFPILRILQDGSISLAYDWRGTDLPSCRLAAGSPRSMPPEAGSANRPQ